MINFGLGKLPKTNFLVSNRFIFYFLLQFWTITHQRRKRRVRYIITERNLVVGGSIGTNFESVQIFKKSYKVSNPKLAENEILSLPFLLRRKGFTHVSITHELQFVSFDFLLHILPATYAEPK